VNYGNVIVLKQQLIIVLVNTHTSIHIPLYHDNIAMTS